MEDDSEHKFLELRPMRCELDVLSRSDGSALFAQGETAVLSSVHGPVEVKLQNLQYDKSSVEVYYKSKSGQQSVGDRFREQYIRNTCESALLTALYPRTAISLQLQEMEDRAGLIACAVNASCLSLLHSGLEMRFLVAAVHCALRPSGALLLDPDARTMAEEGGFVATFTFAFESVSRRTVAVHTEGHFTAEQFNEAQELCAKASEAIFDFYRKSLKKYMKVYC
ncbi:exosome complex component RRP46-like [Phlebotomus argentipes]|uniref:exosome complex component RRP46-like n=1 Tax=Phlebotomus argentipes TaxID=94469 RepID=UPI00289333EE|nr:exosome complex component RRP46-like [Phlebotomus argentipes]